MSYNGKLFLAFSATILAGVSIGYLLSDSEKNKIAKRLANKLINEKNKGFNQALDDLKSKLHDEADSLSKEVEEITLQMI